MQKHLEATTITVPVPLHDSVRRGTLRSIIRQSELPKWMFGLWGTNLRFGDYTDKWPGRLLRLVWAAQAARIVPVAESCTIELTRRHGQSLAEVLFSPDFYSIFGGIDVAQALLPALLPAASALMPTLAFDTVSRPRTALRRRAAGPPRRPLYACSALQP